MSAAGDGSTPLVAPDTNVLSAVALDHPGVREGFLRRFEGWTIGVSPYCLLELRQSPGAYGAFLETFASLPCALLKTAEQLFAEEQRPRPPAPPHVLDPQARAFGVTGSGSAFRDALERALPAVAREREIGWPALKAELLGPWLELRPRFEPLGDRYRAHDGVSFVNGATLEYVRAHADEREPARPSTRAFRSVRMALWTLFFQRFWAEQRRGARLDLLDALISSAAPYVDAVVTENFQADIYRKVARLEPSLLHLDALTLTDVRERT